jgi:hypothetical protein
MVSREDTIALWVYISTLMLVGLYIFFRILDEHPGAAFCVGVFTTFFVGITAEIQQSTSRRAYEPCKNLRGTLPEGRWTSKEAQSLQVESC